jgi:glycosyltransferase involved in cell wall biosynthesis
VVVSRAGSLPEVCGQAALYCDPYNVGDIADKINVLWTDSMLRQQMRKRGREQARKFDWQNSARKLSEIINEFI